MRDIVDKTIHSKELLKPEMRFPHQTVGFVYKALDLAEKQIEEQLDEMEKLKSENLRLLKITK